MVDDLEDLCCQNARYRSPTHLMQMSTVLLCTAAAACTTRYNRLESITFIGVQSKDAFAALLHNPELNVVEMEWSSAFVFAKQMNATTISLPSSHASLLSYPNEIAQLILNAAKGSSSNK